MATFTDPKYNAMYIAALGKFGVRDTASTTHDFFQLHDHRSMKFMKSMISVINKCDLERDVVNALTRAMIENKLEDLHMHLDADHLLPTTADATRAKANIGKDKVAATAAITKEELTELEAKMGAAKKRKLDLVKFRISKEGKLVGYKLRDKKVLAYPGEEVEEEEEKFETREKGKGLGGEIAVEEQGGEVSGESGGAALPQVEDEEDDYVPDPRFPGVGWTDLPAPFGQRKPGFRLDPSVSRK